jgi:hypothetical protein
MVRRERERERESEKPKERPERKVSALAELGHRLNFGGGCG